MIFMVVATGRCGFHFLASLLESTMKFEVVREFDSSYVRESDRPIGWKVDLRTLDGALRCLSDRGTEPDRWIRLVRRDKLAQAKSQLRRRDAKRSIIRKHEREKLRAYRNIKFRLNDNEISSMLSYTKAEERELDRFVEDLNPHIIYYEDFIEPDTWPHAVGGILDFLGIPYEEPLHLSTDLVRLSEVNS